MSSFRELLHPAISKLAFSDMHSLSPKRICFGSTHRNALKRAGSGTAVGFFNVPFGESIKALFPWSLFPNKKFAGFFRTVSDEREYHDIERWLSDHAELVFIRSLLTSAVAACEHYTDNGRSRIGELEKSAKYDHSRSAAVDLIGIMATLFERLYSDKRIDGLIAVPPSTGRISSLPSVITANLAQRLGLADFNGAISWIGPKESVKELDVALKWDALETAGLSVNESVSGKDLLLIDDMYQSGATVHFIASKLRQAGANDIHLLAVSKGRRDTDNT